MYIQFLKNTSQKDISLSGGKAAALGEMLHGGMPVPEGFIVTTKAYQEFHKGEFSLSFTQELEKAFQLLNAPRVAVRSSAVAEDSSNASWAGQLESYLNVTKKNLLESIKKCWDSINSQRAQVYARNQKISKDKLVVAVIIQKMVTSEVSGVVFTHNPVNNDAQEIVIESCFGLGELLVQGSVTPDNYVVARDTLAIKAHMLHDQKTMLVYRDGKQQEVDVPTKWQEKSSLTDDQVKAIAKLAIKIEKYFKTPQDIEWAFEDGKLHVLQSRPITTF